MKYRRFFSILLLLFVILANGCNPVNPTATFAPVDQTNASPAKNQIIPFVSNNPTTPPHGKTLTVTSTNDTGSGTLRQAMQAALPWDTITFDTTIFPPNSPVIISPLSPLPELSRGSITIDASNAGVILDGATMIGGGDGLTITSNGNTIMGLQVIDFPVNGISLQNAAQNNIIGGDRNIGGGQLGQGNLLSGNKERGIVLGGESAFNLITGNFIGTDVSGTLDYGNGMDGLHMNGASDNQVLNNLISGNDGHGMDLCCSETTRKNTISRNLIGTDITGTAVLGNFGSGVALHDGANHNVIGPENLIAFNGGNGIEVGNPATLNNPISQNSIFDNKGLSINLWDGGNEVLAAPNIFDIDAGAGTVTGWACSDCIVEFFSVRDGKNPYYEGQVKTDNTGNFAFSKGKAFDSPVLFATATDIRGNSSKVSLSTTGINRTLVMQTGNGLPILPIKPLISGDLADNGIGVTLGWSTDCTSGYLMDEFLNIGAKRVKVAVSELEPESNLGGKKVTVDWSRPEFSITPNQENCINTYLNNGVSITYILSFWDKANHPNGWQPQVSRFQTQDEIDRYLEYVRFIVNHFKGRIEHYEMWNEPNNKTPLQWVRAADYINLVKQTIPVIHQEDPEAKIVIGGIVLQQPEDRDYLFTLLKSDLMPLVDVVSWHAMFGVSPKNNAEYYYGYPALIRVSRMRQPPMVSRENFGVMNYSGEALIVTGVIRVIHWTAISWLPSTTYGVS